MNSRKLDDEKTQFLRQLRVGNSSQADKR